MGKHGEVVTASFMIMRYEPHQDEVKIKVKEVLYYASWSPGPIKNLKPWREGKHWKKEHALCDPDTHTHTHMLRTFESKKEKVKGGWIKLHHEELHDLFSLYK